MSSNHGYGGYPPPQPEFAPAPPQQPYPMPAPQYAAPAMPTDVMVRAQQLLAEAPQPNDALLRYVTEAASPDKKALQAKFDDDDVFKLSWGRVPKHKAYVKRLCEVAPTYFYTILGQTIVAFANDIWYLTAGRMVIPGVGVCDAVGAASFRDKAFGDKSTGANIHSPGYGGYAPSKNANKSEMDNMWPQFMKLAETNAFTRCAFRLGVGLEDADDEEDGAAAATYTPPPPPPSGGPGMPPPPGAAPVGPPPMPPQPGYDPSAAGWAPAPVPQQPPMYGQPPQAPPVYQQPAMPAPPMAPMPQAPMPQAPMPQAPMPQAPPQAHYAAPQPPDMGQGAPTVNTLTGKPSDEQLQRLRDTIAHTGIPNEALAGILANFGLADISEVNVAQLGSIENLVKQYKPEGDG